MRDTVFITTKPLQILVAVSIIKQLGIEKSSRLIIIDSFRNAELVCERMASAEWSLKNLELAFMKSRREAHSFVSANKTRNVFIDGDVGVRWFLDLLYLKSFFRNRKINVYEEGLGTYRTDIYSNIKKKLFNFFGIGTNYGGCIFTDNIYLYDKCEYLKNFPSLRKKAIGISCGVSDIISNEVEFWSRVFGCDPIVVKNNAECNIYLSSWTIDKEFLKSFRKMSGDKYIKPHPHIKENLRFEFSEMISGCTPAEFILMDLVKKYEKVNVFHHGSSVDRYISAENLEFKKI